ncbi:MAG TPA: TetR/AcrR family transcriptional regulator [Thermoanaerobaculia bacterium]|jgi:AcrR family transcriptional regulator|nr:TetR/AcrR family transcriptional regulator [Thermoanaerobaculia bacterium]
MSPAAARQPARTARQEELLDLALALVRVVGIAGLTVRKLAERAGFTEAALYRHFHNKQALLLAMVERVSEERLLQPLREIAADAQRTPRQRLAAVVRHHVSTILALEGLPVLILAEAAAAGDEALLARFRTVVGELRAIIGRLIAEAGGPPQGVGAPALGVVLIGIGAATALQQRLGAPRSVEREVRDVLPALVVERLLGPEPKRRRTGKARKARKARDTRNARGSKR